MLFKLLQRERRVRPTHCHSHKFIGFSNDSYVREGADITLLPPEFKY